MTSFTLSEYWTNSVRTKFFMAIGAVSALLILPEQGLKGLLIVATGTAIFYFRSPIKRRIEPLIDVNQTGWMILPFFFTMGALYASGALVFGFFVNGFVIASGGWLFCAGIVFMIVVVWKFHGWQMWLIRMTSATKLEDIEREKFPNARGWTTERELANRFNLPVASTYTDADMVGIHIGNAIHWNELGHILTVGGAGQGKGTCLVLPALLSDGLVRAGISVVCLDPKGENAAVAAAHLKRAGYDVHIINPLNIKHLAGFGNSRWNPFDLVEEGSEKKFCDLLAFSLHNRQSGGDGEFFNSRCRQYISLYMRYVLHFNRSLEDESEVPLFDQLYHLLRLSGETRENLLAKMAGDDTFSGHSDAEAILSRVMSSSIKTEESIFSTIEEAINILADENLLASLEASDFDMREIAQRPTAVFICVKHEELRYYAAWLRMFTDMLLKTLTNYYNPDRKVLVLLDEFAQLGYVDQFSYAPAVLRGYNVTLWPIVQEIGQLQKTYGREAAESFISNSVVKHWIGGTMDNTTADYVAKRMPKRVEIIYDDNGRPRGQMVPLLDTQGIINYGKIIGEASKLSAPFEVHKIPYWQWRFAMNNASPNPFYKK
jgi:type IV secretion system protein VirD4